MSDVSCHDVRWLAAEFALGVLPGDERAAVLAHLERCAPCRAEVDELASAADEVLLAAPTEAPSPDFAERVTRSIAAHEAHDERGVRSRRLSRRLVAAAAAVLLVAGAVGGLAVALSHDNAHAPRSLVRSASLVTPRGLTIGSVAWSGTRPAWIEMRVDEGRSDSETYRCILDLSDGTSRSVGTLATKGGHGQWGATVAVDARSVTGARVIDANGDTVATASWS